MREKQEKEVKDLKRVLRTKESVGEELIKTTKIKKIKNSDSNLTSKSISNK